MNNIAKGKNNKKQTKQLMLWIGALVVGAALGMLGIAWLNGLMNFIATVYTRLFQLLAVPTIALAVMTTLASLGNQADTGKIFRHAITYTLLTTFAAAAVGLVLYNVIAPGNLPAALVQSGMADVPQNLGETSYYDHILGVIPNNIVKPFADGNVLSILMLAAAVGIALAKMPQNDKKEVVVKGLFGLQDLLFMLIHGLIWALPLGIVAFAAQLSAQFSAGIVMASLGKYVAVILGGNVIQFFIVLPLFLMARGINPFRTLGRMAAPAGKDNVGDDEKRDGGQQHIAEEVAFIERCELGLIAGAFDDAAQRDAVGGQRAPAAGVDAAGERDGRERGLHARLLRHLHDDGRDEEEGRDGAGPDAGDDAADGKEYSRRQKSRAACGVDELFRQKLKRALVNRW